MRELNDDSILQSEERKKITFQWGKRVFTLLCSFFLFFLSLLPLNACSVIFNVDPDTHIDSIDQAESAVLEGTANWSAKIAVTGISLKSNQNRLANIDVKNRV